MCGRVCVSKLCMDELCLCVRCVCVCEYVCVVCGHDQRCPTPGSAAKGNRCVTIDYVSANVQRRPSRKRMAHDWRLDDVCVWVCVCATQNDGGCEFVPRLPREATLDEG